MDPAAYARLVAYIAANRYPFPDQTNWPADYVTITNVPERRHAIPTPDGDAYPAIVIVDGEGRLREGGVVETAVTDDLGPVWARYAPAFDTTRETGVRHFFIYVPEGREQRARQLLDRHAVSYAGLRAWALDGDAARITPIVTPGDSQDHR